MLQLYVITFTPQAQATISQEHLKFDITCFVSSQTKFYSWPNQVSWTDINFSKTALVTAVNDKSVLLDKLSSRKVFINIWFCFCTIVVHLWGVRVQQKRPIWGSPQGLRDEFWHCWTTVPIKHVSRKIWKITLNRKWDIWKEWKLTLIEKEKIWEEEIGWHVVCWHMVVHVELNAFT